jgi:hypothetical protein
LDGEVSGASKEFDPLIEGELGQRATWALRVNRVWVNVGAGGVGNGQTGRATLQEVGAESPYVSEQVLDALPLLYLAFECFYLCVQIGDERIVRARLLFHEPSLLERLDGTVPRVDGQLGNRAEGHGILRDRVCLHGKRLSPQLTPLIEEGGFACRTSNLIFAQSSEEPLFSLLQRRQVLRPERLDPSRGSIHGELEIHEIKGDDLEIRVCGGTRRLVSAGARGIDSVEGLLVLRERLLPLVQKVRMPRQRGLISDTDFVPSSLSECRSCPHETEERGETQNAMHQASIPYFSSL